MILVLCKGVWLGKWIWLTFGKKYLFDHDFYFFVGEGLFRLKLVVFKDSGNTFQDQYFLSVHFLISGLLSDSIMLF